MAAVQRYAERFPGKRQPNRKTISRLALRLRSTGSVLPAYQTVGRGRGVEMVDVDEEILHRIDTDPMASTREIASEVEVSHWTVWRILKEGILYPYHFQRVQSLIVNDYPRRQQFCQWLLTMCDQHPDFCSSTLMTDGCCFTRNGILNFHNNNNQST